MKKKILSILLALVMLLGLLPGAALAAGDSTAEVTLSAQAANAFMLVPQKVSVSSGLAERYGYADSVDGVSALDVLVKAHELAFGSEAFTPETAGTLLSVSGTGMVTNAFGNDAAARGIGFGYAVNGVCPHDDTYIESYFGYTGYTVEAAAVESGDHVEFFFYQDSYWSDNYAWFEHDGVSIDTLYLKTGEAAELALKGYCYAYYSASPASMRTSMATELCDCPVYNMDGDGNMDGTVFAGVTDADAGTASVSFDTAGTYVLSAGSDTGYTEIFSPWLTVIVKDVLTAQDYIDAAMANLTAADVRGDNSYSSAVSMNFTLPASVYPNTTISWACDSEDADVVSCWGNDVYITPKSAAVSATLTATVSTTIEGDISNNTASFSITVPPEKRTDTPAGASSFKGLMDEIAATYTSSDDGWVVLDMAAYGASGASVANDAYHTAVAALTSADGINVLGKYALAERALGDLDSFQNIAAMLTESSNAYPSVSYESFALLTYHSADNTEKANGSVTYLLSNALPSGGWAGWTGLFDADTTAIALAALAPYYHRDDVKAQVDKAVAALSASQNDNGGWQSNANSTAAVIVALAALGIEAHTDSRFISDEHHSAIEGLLYYALADNTGFGYGGNQKLNVMATEQGFRALVAYARFVETVAAGGTAYNIYLDADVTMAAPADPKISTTVAPQPVTPSGPSDEISVTFKLSGDTSVWLTETVTVKSGISVYDVFADVLTRNGYTYEGTSGYISYITSPAGVRLGEFSTGADSGWLYKVNGTLPSESMGDYILAGNATIVFYYTNDWTQDPDAGNIGGGPSAKPEEEEPEPVELAFTDVHEDAWYYDAVAFAVTNKLFTGVSEMAFAPEQDMTRGMLVTVLHRLAGLPAAGGENPFADVPADNWFTEAILWAAENGLVGGYGDGSFGVNDSVTREQLAAILFRYAALQGLAPADFDAELHFADKADISAWAQQAVAWCRETGIIEGRDGNRFDPQARASRAEVAALLMRFSQFVESQTEEA